MKKNHRFYWKRWLPAHNAPAWAVIILMVSYALFFSAFTLAQHRAFLTLGFDLGNVDQALWSTTQGRILRYTNWPGGTIRFGNHFEPILLLVSLTYFIHSGPETLLVLQSLVLAAGAWPIFRLAGRRLESEWMGVLFAALYLLFPGLEAANVFDFHAVALAPTCLAWAFWSLEQARYKRFVVWGLLAMACKEEIPLIVALMGVWLAARGRRWLGLAIAGLGVAWTATALLVIIPGLNTLDVSPQLNRYSQLGQGPKQMLVNLVTHPHLYVETLTAPLKTQYLVKLFFPTGYLALLAPHVLLLAAPSFAVNLLSSRPHMVALEKFHYTAPLAPFVIIAGAYGLAWAARGLGRVFRRVDRRFILAVLGSYVLLFSLFYHRFNGLTPLALNFTWPKTGEHERIGHQLIEQIPPTTSVSAQNQLNPHLTQRRKVYVFPRIEDAEYVLVDVTVYPYVEPVEKYNQAVRDLLASSDFGIAAASDGYILFQRGAGKSELPDAFYTAFEPPDGSGPYVARATFVEGPALADVAWRLEKGNELVVETVWLRPAGSLVEGQIVVELIESPAAWQAQTEQPLTLTRWYPPQEWPQGQPVRDTARLALSTDAPLGALSIGLIFRTPAGETHRVALSEGVDWQLDASAAILLVPLVPTDP